MRQPEESRDTFNQKDQWRRKGRRDRKEQGVMSMQDMDAVRVWVEWHLRSRQRRDDTGGLTDETAMIGLMLLAAVAVAGIITGLVTGAAGRINFGF
jgi:hypothetical protein